jgi:hypothetical protein
MWIDAVSMTTAPASFLRDKMSLPMGVEDVRDTDNFLDVIKEAYTLYNKRSQDWLE